MRHVAWRMACSQAHIDHTCTPVVARSIAQVVNDTVYGAQARCMEFCRACPNSCAGDLTIERVTYSTQHAHTPLNATQLSLPLLCYNIGHVPRALNCWLTPPGSCFPVQTGIPSWQGWTRIIADQPSGFQETWSLAPTSRASNQCSQQRPA